MKREETPKMCAVTCDCDECEEFCWGGGGGVLVLCKPQKEYKFLEGYPVAV